MISIDEAIRIIRDNISEQILTENVSLDKCWGRITARDYFCDVDFPAFDRSAMDGYVVVDDSYSEYRVKGVIRAGETSDARLHNNECMQIMTGAPVIPGAKKVIIKEHVLRKDDMIKVICDSDRINISCRGEDVVKGELAVPAHTLITPYTVGGLSAVGADPVKVFERIKIDILITGDELIPVGEKPRDGFIRDINSHNLINMVCSMPYCEMAGSNHVHDDLEKIRTYINTFTCGKSNILLISGGSSMGDYDYTSDALTAEGYEILFDKIKIKPGKPVIFAKKEDKIVFGLPGNPVSVLISFENFVKEAIMKIAGIDYKPVFFEAVLDDNFSRKHSDRPELVPVRLTNRDDKLFCHTVKYNGSGNILAYHDIHHAMIINENTKKILKGEKVIVRSLWQNY